MKLEFLIILLLLIPFTTGSQDTTAPVLNVYSPTQISSIPFFVNLTGYDNVKWEMFTITFGGVNVYSVSNTETNYSSYELTYNTTFISVTKWIDLSSFKSLPNNTLSISLSDTSGNTNTIDFTVPGDFVSPKISWNYLSGTTVNTSVVSISWQIIDDSDISSQNLVVNGKQISIYPYTRSVNITAEKEGPIYITLTAVDRYNNRGTSSLVIMYKSQNSENQTGPNNLIIYSITSILIIFIVIITAKFIKRNKNIFKGELVNPPLLEAVEFLGKNDNNKLLELTDHFIKLEEKWNELVENYTDVKDKTIIKTMLDDYMNHVILTAANYKELTVDQLNYLENMFNQWRNKILEKK